MHVFYFGVIGFLLFFPNQVLCKIISNCRKPGTVAVTFDEGPSKKFTPVILKHLRDAGIKATFHVSTSILHDPKAAAIAKRIISEGHLLGIRYAPYIENIGRIPPSHFRSLLEADRQMIKDILNYDVKYVRLPYGSYPKDAIKFAEQLGFVITEHSLDSKDFLGSSDAMVHSYQNALSPTSNFIAVHRDHAKVTALYLPNIILLIKKQRLRPFLLSQCI